MPTQLQNTSGSIVGATSQSLAYPSNVTAGSLLVAFAAVDGVSAMSVSDSLGQTWSSAIGVVKSSMRLFVYYFANTKAGACTPTLAISPSANASLSILEYSGVAKSAPVNATATSSGTNNSPSPGSVTAAAGQLIVTGYIQTTANLSSCSIGGAFTLRTNILLGAGNGVGLGTADDVNASGSLTSTFTMSASEAWAAAAVSFKAATPSFVPPWWAYCGPLMNPTGGGF